MGIFSEDFYNSTSNKSASKQSKQVPMLKDYAIDLETGQLLYNHNEPYIVEGIDACVCLIWKRLYTKKKNLSLDEGCPIYTDNYGSSIHLLKGKTKAYGDSIIEQMLIDSLIDGTYVLNIVNIQTSLSNKGVYTVSFAVGTRYGAVKGSIFVEETNAKIMLWTDNDNADDFNYFVEKY